jgi:hypothetical protein
MRQSPLAAFACPAHGLLPPIRPPSRTPTHDRLGHRCPSSSLIGKLSDPPRWLYPEIAVEKVAVVEVMQASARVVSLGGMDFDD